MLGVTRLIALVAALGVGGGSLARLALAQNDNPDTNPLIQEIRTKIKDTSKPFTMWVTFTAKAGRAAELEQACRVCAKATNKEAGCLAYQLNQDADNPNVFVLYERWKNLDALVAHLKEKHTQTLLQAVPELTEGGPQIKLFVAKD